MAIPALVSPAFILLLSAWKPMVPEGQVPTWTLREEIRIGAADHPTESLTAISHVVVDARGRIYVAQPDEQTIRVFDRSGAFVRSLGRAGDGPGEFRRLHSIGFLGDSLYATDAMLRRVTMFGPDGEVLGTYSRATPLVGTRRQAIYAPTVPSMLLPDGSALAWPSISLRERAGGKTRDPLLLLSADGESVDTLAEAEVEPPNVVANVRGRRLGIRRPFADGPLHTFLADGTGVLVVHRRSPADRRRAFFKVIKIGLTGDTVFIRNFTYTPKEVSDELVDLAIDELERRLASRPNPPNESEIRDALESGGHIPRFVPPVTQIASGVDGSIWLKREQTVDSRAAWQVLDPSGDIRALVLLPRNESVRAVVANILITSAADDLDVPYVVRYAIDTGGRR